MHEKVLLTIWTAFIINTNVVIYFIHLSKSVGTGGRASEMCTSNYGRRRRMSRGVGLRPLPKGHGDTWGWWAFSPHLKSPVHHLLPAHVLHSAHPVYPSHTLHLIGQVLNQLYSMMFYWFALCCYASHLYTACSIAYNSTAKCSLRTESTHKLLKL